MPAGGELFLVATPIGNLGDLSSRARDTLAAVDVIACEDTRTSAKLCRHFGIEAPLESYHEHNEAAKAEELAARVAEGQKVALISDAGTPALSDPGFRLVRACRRLGLKVTPIPGPAAAIAALTASAFPVHKFLFHGFLPPKKSARQKFLAEHADFDGTLILYESSHRILKFAEDIAAILGAGRMVAICRELTKKHETFLIGPIEEILPRLSGGNLKGEFVVLIAPKGYAF